jgi:hypothetical protein
MAQLACMFLMLAIGGCKGMFGPQGLPPDPLFAHRTPTESKAVTGPAQAPPYSEPAPALNPYYAGDHPVAKAQFRPDSPRTNPGQ